MPKKQKARLKGVEMKKSSLTKKQLKAILRPMFCGTKLFGYATDADVERMLENVSKDSPLIKGKESSLTKESTPFVRTGL